MPRIKTPVTQVPDHHREQMDAAYLAGGLEKMMAPHVVYAEKECPYPNCHFHLQAIDFRVEEYGRDIHDRLVRAWWENVGFAGQCPSCHGWLHFQLKSKRALSAEEADQLPQLPVDWHEKALIL